MTGGITEYVASLGLTSVAMTFNGTTIDGEVLGYRTLKVEGRESLSADVSETDYLYSAGSRFQKHRRKARDLKVSFAITVDTKETYLKSFQKLRGLLSTYDDKEKQVIFADDLDYYYTGSVTEITAEPVDTIDGYAATGEITIHCTDPNKYSVEQKTVTGDNSTDGEITFTFDYDGTAPANVYVKLNLNTAEDYLILTDTNKHIIVGGTADRVGTDYYKSSETLKHIGADDFDAIYNFATELNHNISTSGYLDKDANKNNANHYGISFVSDANPFNIDVKSPYGGGYVKFLQYQLNKDFANWGGSFGIYDIPDDSLGDSNGSKWWELYFLPEIAATAPDQFGFIQVVALTSDLEPVAGFMFMKAGIGDVVSIDHWVGDRCVYSHEIPGAANGVYPNNKYFLMSDTRFTTGCSIERLGTNVDKDNYQRFRFTDNEIHEYTAVLVRDKYVKKIGIGIGELKKYNKIYAFGLRALGFRKDYGPAPHLISNKFNKNDVVEFDTENNSIRVNSVVKPGYGALGNDWENFKVYPGANTITISYPITSENTNINRPTGELTFREVFE